MANALYDKAREAFLTGAINWLNDTIKVIAIDTANYTVNLATHQYLSDIPAAARVAVSAALTGKSATNGVADADDVVFTAPTGNTVEALVIYQDTGTEATSRLIAYIDTATEGLPFTPSGVNVTVKWDDGPNKIFRI